MEAHDASPIRVFLVDDHEVVRAGIKAVLDLDPGLKVVGEAASAGTTLPGVARARPDVLVLDVRLPDGSGIDICREVTKQFPEVATILFTSIADERSRGAARAAGARGYLLKKARTDELLAGIRAVSAGADLLEGLQPATEARGGRGRMSALSPQERAVVHFVGQGMTNKQIAHEMALAEKTVKNYVSNVLTKLGMTRRTQVASFAATAEAGMERMTFPESWDEAGLDLDPCPRSGRIQLSERAEQCQQTIGPGRLEVVKAG